MDPLELYDEDEEPPPPRRGPGPVVLVLPLALFVVSVVWLATARPPRVPRGQPRVEPAVPAVQGWTGGWTRASVARYSVTLTPLHADPRRQLFERAALARRLGLDPEGEPFRLELRTVAEEDWEGIPESLTELVVRDGLGVCLRPIPAASPTGPADVADPLAVLLEPPSELALGEALSVVLWGRAPREQAILEQFAVQPIELTPTAFTGRTQDEALATLERAPREEGR